MTSSPLTIIAEDLAGMRSQAFGLAERLGFEARLLPIEPRGVQRFLPPALWPMPLRMIKPREIPSLPGAVFSVAGKGAPIGAALRRRGHPVVQIQNPRMRLDRFDLVVANVHDEIEGPNVLLGRTALHGLTPEKLALARATWMPRLRQDDSPLLAALVGGANGRFRFGRTEAEALGRMLIEAARKANARLFVTTSRRTGDEATAVLSEAVQSVGGTLWSGGGDNPYPGLIACADFLIVTTDSISMMSEAVASHAPVYIHALPGSSRRIGVFVRTLLDCGRARRFEGVVEAWDIAPLDDTPGLAQEIRLRLGL